MSWREVANTYFDRSASWLYHKLDGIDGNGGVGGFTDKEKEQLRGALVDLSDRIRRAADNISAGDCITPLRHKSSAPTDAHQPRDFTVSRHFVFGNCHVHVSHNRPRATRQNLLHGCKSRYIFRYERKGQLPTWRRAV